MGPPSELSAGLDRDGVGTKDPCQKEEQAWEAAVAAQRATQAALKRVNSEAEEKRVKATKDKKQIADWERRVKKATKANNDAAQRVTETFNAFQKCQTKKGKSG